MNYADSLQLLYERSDPERGPGFWSGGGDPTMGPQRTRAMLAEAGNPQDRIACFHVAGSTGKGTTCIYLAAGLRRLGQSVGLYTQPHLHSYRERLQVDRTPISGAQFAAAAARAFGFEAASRRRGPDLGPATTFELTTVMAFDWFAHRGVDSAVIETGLGGRLDATNVISAPAGVLLTPIESEHAKILGPGISRIASEKAAIVRPGSAVASAPQSAAAARVIEARCRQIDARLSFLASDEVRMAAKHIAAPQLAASAALALRALAMTGRGRARSGMIEHLAGEDLPARCEVVAAVPPLIIDGGHTVRAMASLAEFVAGRFAGRAAQVVFGCSRDKPASDLLGVWRARAAGLHLCAADHPRATAPSVLAGAVGSEGISQYPDVSSALAAARRAAGGEGVVVATGSMHLAAAARSEALGTAPEFEPIPATART